MTRCLDCSRPSAKSRCPDCEAKRPKRVYRKRARSYYDSADWRKLRAKVKARDKDCIIGIGCEGKRIAHHVRPRKAGGSDSLDNLVYLCWKHHNQVEADIKAGEMTPLRLCVENYI